MLILNSLSNPLHSLHLLSFQLSLSFSPFPLIQAQSWILFLIVSEMGLVYVVECVSVEISSHMLILHEAE